MRLDRANGLLGFWVECGFIDLDRGNLWPRQYFWKCGCMGVSVDGENVIVAPCADHPDLMDSLPDGSLYVEEIRKQMASRVRPFGRVESHLRYGGAEMMERDRQALLQAFDSGRKHARHKNKRQDRKGTPGGVPDSSDQQDQGSQD